MNNKIKYLFLGFAILSSLFIYTNISEAKTKHTLQDFGLTEENVKFLSQKEIDQILNGLTPEETKAYIKEQAEKSSATSTFISPPSIDQGVNIPKTKNSINCFDYYHFGSIKADIFSSSKNAVPGMKMQFTGKITNTNKYPIVNGTLYVKIFRQRSESKEPNGPDVVDQFIAESDITIKENGSIPIDFEWYVPLNSLKGDYTVATYFLTDNKYNLMGLSFTDDVIGGTFDFKVNGVKSIVLFDKSSVKINTKDYFFAAFPPRLNDKESANIEAKIMNNTNKDQKVSVNWKLYKWDSLGKDNFIKELNTNYTVKANTSLLAKLTISDKDYPVYYLVGELKYVDSKSILGIRFVRDGVDRLRINFPSITSFPIKKGEASSVFSCVHNSGTSKVVNDGKLILNVMDKDGAIVDEYAYNGPISGEMMGFKKDFISKKNLDKFTVNAELWQGNNMIEKTSILYDCNSIDPNSCIKGNNNQTLILISIIALIVIAIAFGIHKKRMLPISIVLLLIISSVFFISPSITEAKNVSWHNTYDGYLSYFYNFDDGYMWNIGSTGWVTGLGPRDVTITYDTEIINSDNNSIVWDTSEVPVGANLILKFKPHKYTDIFWFGSGYSYDSPYGQWRENAAPPKSQKGIHLGSKVFYVWNYGGIKYNNIEFGAYAVDKDGYITANGIKYTPLTNNVFGQFKNESNYTSYAMSPSFLTPSCPNTEYDPNNPNTLQDIRDVASFVYTVGGASTNPQAYISLVLNPPTKTITDTDGMQCGLLTGNEKDGYSMQCKITGNGQLHPKFNFSSTYGYYFYRYFWHDYYEWGCHGNNIPMTGPGSTVDVPVQTISYQITAIPVAPSNKPPLPPTITGPSSGSYNDTHVFNIVSTDPDNDQIRYGIDWDNNNIVDQWLPLTDLVNSGTSETMSKTWSNQCEYLGCTGTQYFNAIAVDSNGQASTWSTFSINLSDPNSPNTNISCLLQSNKNSVTSGDSITLTWSSDNANTCSLSENGSQISTLLNGSMTRSNIIDTKSYTLTCNNPSSNPLSCNSSVNVSINNLVSTLPLWLNGDTNTSSITVRPGQNFGINWKASGNIQNLVSGSCKGTTVDANDNYIQISNWSNPNDPDNPVTLPDDKDSTPLTTSIPTKGQYKFILRCNRSDGNVSDIIYSNEVKVRVVQPTIQEK